MLVKILNHVVNRALVLDLWALIYALESNVLFMSSIQFMSKVLKQPEKNIYWPATDLIRFVFFRKIGIIRKSFNSKMPDWSLIY